jgi:hypothetical protein
VAPYHQPFSIVFSLWTEQSQTKLEDGFQGTGRMRHQGLIERRLHHVLGCEAHHLRNEGHVIQ